MKAGGIAAVAAFQDAEGVGTHGEWMATQDSGFEELPPALLPDLKELRIHRPRLQLLLHQGLRRDPDAPKYYL